MTTLFIQDKFQRLIYEFAQLYKTVILFSASRLEHMQTTSVYLLLANKNPTEGEQGIPISTKLLSFLAISSICILQYQIEKSGIDRASTNKQILRIVSIVVILAVGYVPWRLETKDFSSKWPLFYILNGLISSFFFSVLPPILFITSHHYLRRFAILKIRSIISKFNIPGIAKLTTALRTSKTSPMIHDVIV